MVDVITTNKALQPTITRHFPRLRAPRTASVGDPLWTNRPRRHRAHLRRLDLLALWRRYVTTDDAYVQGNVLNVTTDVSGLVDQILVHEGQMVQQGQVLFRLDPTEFQISIDRPRRTSGRRNCDSDR